MSDSNIFKSKIICKRCNSDQVWKCRDRSVITLECDRCGLHASAGSLETAINTFNRRGK